MRKTDYPELEGKIITFEGGGRIAKVKVIGCSYHVGITAVGVDHPSWKAICLNRKIHTVGRWSKKTYMATFRDIVRRIQLGHYDVVEARIATSRPNDNRPGNQTCAFV